MKDHQQKHHIGKMVTWKLVGKDKGDLLSFFNIYNNNNGNDNDKRIKVSKI